MIVTSGEDQKRTGRQLVLAFDDLWKSRVTHELRIFCIGRKKQGKPEFAFEEFRRVCAAQNIFPRHHNAWGALASAAAKEGIIEDTGKYRKAVSKRTHAHPVRIWRAV